MVISRDQEDRGRRLRHSLYVVLSSGGRIIHTSNGGDISSTGKKVTIRYALGLTHAHSKCSRFYLIFAQAELMAQLASCRHRKPETLVKNG